MREHGEAIMRQVAEQRLASLIDSDYTQTTLISACITQAIRQGVSPRAVALSIWDGLPSDEIWEAMREHVTEATDNYGEEERRAA